MLQKRDRMCEQKIQGERRVMYEIMNADEAIRLIRDGDCICVNSFVGIENPVELHEAIYRTSAPP